jgi:predicted metal-dependent enzyme (double-stranded beta helix superfamily)
MGYAFDRFCADMRAALKADRGATGREQARLLLEKLLADADFVARECGPAAKPGIRTIYRDEETGFNVLVHVYADGKKGPPHDHGRSWAIYGQAAGWTDMTVWKRRDDGTKEGFADVEPVNGFRLEPGMAGRFEPGDIHSIHFPDGARFVRVTGTDLDAIPTSRFDPEKKAVAVGSRLK